MKRNRILVIDDEPGILRAVERILAPEHQVAVCASPIDALEMAKRDHPDLVICDITMPRLDGFEVMDSLKRAGVDADVIVMTGMPEPDAQLVRAIREKAFYFITKPFNRQVMLTLVNRCLELRRLRRAELEHATRVNGELSEARALQQSMLPEPGATVEGVSIDARYVACSELGGDFFDYAPAGERRAAFVVGDVSGHGVSAAMLTSILKGAFRSSCGDEFSPLAVVNRVLDGIRFFSAQRFVTLFCGCIDARSRELTYVSAGHPAGLLFAAGGNGEIEQLASTGPLVSPAFFDATWEQVTIPLAGRMLLLYTDGVTDVLGDGRRYDLAGIVRQIQSCSGGIGLLDAILSDLRSFAAGRPQVDDFTLLAAGCD